MEDFRVGVCWIKLVIRSANPKKNALSVKERAHTTKDGSFKRVLYFGWPKQPPSGGVSKTSNRVTSINEVTRKRIKGKMQWAKNIYIIK